MQDLIKDHLGAEQFARVEAKAAARGITDVWPVAIERARLELGESAPEADLVARAAIRARQRVGVISRLGRAGTPLPPAPDGGAELPTPPSDDTPAPAEKPTPKTTPKKPKE
jgi:hypothetical protein